MLTTQRKAYLLKILKSEGRIVAKSISAELGLSEDTIRRDLRELAKEGLLQRVHGGGLPVSPATGTFAQRQHISTDAKVAIGRAAAKMVRHGQVIFVDGGTTTAQLVRHLPLELSATVVTHSPSIAVELIEHPNIEVIMIGGRLFKHSIVTMGPAALEAIAKIQADLYFMGVCSLHPESGLTTGDFDEAGIKRALSRAAAETVVLASPEKLATASPFQIVPLSDIGCIVVSKGVSKDLIAPYKKMGIEIKIAE
ncbi:MAG: DeoR/GlpR transcriptional regulator [Sphingobacteriales bacterium]|nr:MAG: DeoR/GlpR transcriptional regulator [Sphingobacteriales bacterium]